MMSVKPLSALSGGELESATRTLNPGWKPEVPAMVGVPEISPEGERDRPGNRRPRRVKV